MQVNPIEEVFKRSCFAAPDTIVVAIDLADTEHLLTHAIAQAKACDAVLCLVHAIPPNDVFVPEWGPVPTMDPMKGTRDARVVLEGLARQVIEQGVACITAVHHGSPAAVVAGMVEEAHAGRVLVSTHGRRGMKRMILGSVAREILRAVDVPVCAVGPHCSAPADATPRKILHPAALREDDDASTRLALDMAQYQHAELTLLHVLSDGEGVTPYLDPQYAFEKLQMLLPQNPAELVATVRIQVVAGDVHEQILNAARETHADLIVMGMHANPNARMGRSANAAYEIIAAAPCPVLCVSPQTRSDDRSAETLRKLYAL